MSRNANRSRVNAQPDRRRQRYEEEPIDRGKEKVLRVHRGERQNRHHLPEMYYAFVARTEGPARGPWYVSFECTELRWMNDAIADLPNNGARRLQHFLNGRTFPVAWAAAGIGDRVVLRSIYSSFLEKLTDRGAPPGLALYEIRLYEEDLTRFGIQPLVVGQWYGIEIVRDPDSDPDVDIGILRQQNPNTNELRDPVSFALRNIKVLRDRASRPTDWIFDAFRSQATLLALHSCKTE